MQVIPGSSWGTFTIACTIPIALFVGLWMYRIRKGRVVEASIIGGTLTLGAVVLGASIPHSSLEHYFNLEPAPDHRRAGDLRLHRRRAAGLAAADAARLFVELHESRHARAASARCDPGEPHAATSRVQPYVSIGRANVQGRRLPVCVHLRHVRGDLRLPFAGRIRHDAEDDR